jgi:hypothetical protein
MSATGNPDAVEFANPADEIFNLVEQLVDATVRLARLEQAQSVAADGDAILARLAAFDARLTALEHRQRRPPNFPISVIENRVETVNVVRHTSNVAAATVNQINGRIHKLTNDVAWLHWRVVEMGIGQSHEPNVAALAARIEDEERARRQDVKRLDNAVANVIRRIDLAAKVFTRFNRHLTAIGAREARTAAPVSETKGE